MRAARVSLSCACILLQAAAGAAQAQQPEAAAGRARRVAADPVAPDASAPAFLRVATFAGFDAVDLGSAPGTSTAVTSSPFTESAVQEGWTVRAGAATTRSSRTMVSISGASTAVHFEQSGNVLIDWNGTATESFAISPRTSIEFDQRVSHAPYYSVGLFPGLDGPAGADVSSAAVPTFQSGFAAASVTRAGGSAQVSRHLTTRTTLMAYYRGDVSVAHNIALADAWLQEGGLRLTHQRTETIGYHIGYGYVATGFAVPGASTTRGPTFHDIDVGADIHKWLSRTRNTLLNVSTGSAIAQAPGAASAESVPADVRLRGHAELEHFFRRSWTARVSYRRDWELLAGSPRPFFNDGFAARIGGNVAPRIRMTAEGGYVLARSSVAPDAGRDHAATASVWLQTALGRGIGIYGVYSNYVHRFEFEGMALPLPEQFDRNGIRVGLVLAFPRVGKVTS